ncbi:metal ABC transporter permease [Ideonella livida]|uniref:Metal ABC transporter permease n=1 Tax=Ideonella livida TaxID=2707176 RepID=A0A7C9PH28_9BURK|nr:metal ABC transporter permease [Ideonella livida]NDY91755.1 metal ABC transporter permease [Ideonella livida]
MAELWQLLATPLAATLWQPFAEFGFMRRALVACLALALAAGPVGTLLVLRRMSLVGDAMAHALLPGAALGYWVAGLSLPAMSLGGFAAAMVVALLAVAVARLTPQREETSFAAFYLLALAAGVMLLSLRASSVDLLHVLFGSVLAVDDEALWAVAGTASLTVAGLSLLLRPLLMDTADPAFARSVGLRGGGVHLAFMVLVVATLVSGFQALGSLMAVGLMMLPAASARFWARRLGGLMAVSTAGVALSSVCGLLLSFHLNVPSGPAIVLCAGGAYCLSLLLGRHDSAWARWRVRRLAGQGPVTSAPGPSP